MPVIRWDNQHITFLGFYRKYIPYLIAVFFLLHQIDCLPLQNSVNFLVVADMVVPLCFWKFISQNLGANDCDIIPNAILFFYAPIHMIKVSIWGIFGEFLVR